MNTLREFKPCVRKYDSLVVIFWKKDTIYLIDDDHETIIQRWWKVRNSYTDWKRLCRSYKFRNNLTYGKALLLAIQAGFGTQSARKVPDYSKLRVIEIKEKK